MNRALLALCLLACGDVDAQSIGGGSIGGGGSGAAADPTPVFSFAPHKNAVGGSGFGNLSGDAFGLTTVVDCDAKTQTATNWPCATGGTFTESDGNPVIAYAAPFTDVNARASEMTDDAYRAPTTTLGEVAAGVDVSMIVVAFVTDRGATQYIAGKYDTVNSEGYAIRVTAGGVVQGVANATTFGSYQLTSYGQWNIYHLICSQDTCSLYVNGKVTGSTGARSGTLATVTSAKNFSVGCRPNGTANDCIDGFVSNVVVRTGSALIVNGSVAATSLQAAHEIMGVWPGHGVVKAPTIATRSGMKYCDVLRDFDAQYKAPSRLFPVGTDWLCVSRRQELSGDGLDIREGAMRVGYFSERAATNLILQSEAFNTTWTKLTVADTVNANPGTRGPNQRTNQVDWIQAAVDVVGLEHGFRQTTASALVAGGTYNFSVYVARIAGDGIDWMYLRDNTIANAYAFFNIQYCYVGTTGAGLRDMGSTVNQGRRGSARVTNVGRMETGEPDWCRIEISITGTAATHDFDIGSATADNDFTHTTTASQRVFIGWGAQLERVPTSDQYGGVRASSYVPTTTATVTKNEDRLAFNESNWPDAGGMILGAELLLDSRVSSAVYDYFTSSNDSTTPCLVEKNNTNFISTIYTGEVDTVKWGMQVSVFTAGVNQWSYTPDGLVPGWWDTHDGRQHHTRTAVFPNDLRIYVDGSPDPAGADTSATLPTIDSGQVSIGFFDALEAQWTQGLVTECSIYTEDWDVPNP